MNLDQINFPQCYQYKKVSAGETDTIWEMPVTGGYEAFIDKVYIRWFTNTWLKFEIDGEPVETPKIEYEVGSLSSPRKYDPPLVARKYVRVIAHNESTQDHVFEAFIDGVLAKPKT